MQQSETFFTPHRVAFGLAVVVIVGGALYYFYYGSVTKTMNTVSAYNAAFEDARSGLADAGVSTTTIDEFQTLFDIAPDKETQTKVAQSLATSLFIRNAGGDRKDAIALIENVVADTANTPRSRAIALTLLGSLVRNQDDAFFRQYFSDATLSKYLPSQGTSVNGLNIAIKIFKDAEAIYPTPYAEYYIAYAYTVLIIQGKLADGAKNETDMAREMQTYVKKGDATIETDASYVPSTLASFYYQRAWSLSYSGRILNNMTLREREAAFTDAITKISAIPPDPYVTAYLFETRFRYAVFLLNSTKGRETDIQQILKPFGALAINLPDAAVAGDYFINLQQIGSAAAKKSVTELVKISPELKGFLVRLGWKL